MSFRSRTTVPLLLVFVLIVLVGARATFRQFKETKDEIPTVRIQRGDMELKVYSTGELRAEQSSLLMAPPVSGSLQIIRLVATGSQVKSGDVVLQFDPSEQEFKLDQARYDLQQAEQEIVKSNADSAVQTAQDQVDLLKARFDVRRAELDVTRNELLSQIDAQKNVLALEEAKRRLAQLEQDVRSRQASNQAALAVVEEKRNKARLDMDQAQRAIDSMAVKSPLDGIVMIKENLDALGGVYFGGMTLPEYREGDLVRPGRNVAEVFGSSDMEIRAKINENDRGNVNAGQSVDVKVDAIPGATYSGKVKTIAGLTTKGMWWESNNARSFDASFKLDKDDPRFKPGESAQVVIQGQQLKGVLLAPRQALFDKDGQPVLYVKEGAAFVPREAKIVARTESQIAVENLREGDIVALVNPEKQPSPTGAKPATPPPSLGGGR